VVTTRAAIVVPCFDEERRLDRARMLAFAAEPQIELLFVDDGSRDGTRAVLDELARSKPERIGVLALDTNGGKGEAVRRGMLRALEGGAPIVGYVDADLSTPPDEVVRLRDEMDTTAVSVVIGSRVQLVGRKIERRNSRHMLGRVFATVAARILETPFYDTQCGAKLFRDVPELRAALAAPFRSRWAFDVELLGRLLVGVGGEAGLPVSEFLEVPLRVWVDAPGSKVDFKGMARSLVDLALIDAELVRLRRAQKGRS
jgi:glycosyltransferase involved in cell wall biosynthesis